MQTLSAPITVLRHAHRSPATSPFGRHVVIARWWHIAAIALALAAALPLAAAAEEQQTPTPVFKPPTFADDTVAYVYGPAFRNPFIRSAEQPDGADIARHAIELKHVDAWRYGFNFGHVQIKKSNDVEPAAGGGTGVIGLYAIFRSGVGINRAAGRQVISLGPLREIAIQGGINLETKNSEFAPEERSIYFGPNLQFRLGGGFLNVGLHVRKEWNHNGDVGKNESYDVNFNVEPVWSFPFRAGRARFLFEGAGGINTPKGRDAAGRDTKTAVILRPVLKLDVSPLIRQKARVLEVGAGFEYWHNMFGKDADRVPGANQVTPVFMLVVHLPGGGAAGH
jgi:hypothetical protein